MTNNWMTVKVKYTKQMDNGTFKRVSEPYLLAAMSFTDAESRIYEELGSVVRGEFIVTGIARTEIHDIFHYMDSDVWWKVVIKFKSGGDDEGQKAKKVKQTLLVTARDEIEAAQRVHESLKGMMIDYQITDVAMSPIVDVFPFGDSETV